MKKRYVTFRLDEDLHQFLKAYAKRRRTTVSQILVNLVVECYECNPLEQEHTQCQQAETTRRP